MGIIDWSRYAPHVPPHDGPQRDLTRSEARETYEHWDARRGERWAQLRLLLPEDVSLGSSDAEIHALDDWFSASVEADSHDPSRLAKRWYAVVNDIAVVLGDVAIARAPHLRWAFFTTSSTDPAYQKQVLTGFTKVKTSRYVVDLDARVVNYAYRLTDGDPAASWGFVDVLDFIRTIA